MQSLLSLYSNSPAVENSPKLNTYQINKLKLDLKKTETELTKQQGRRDELLDQKKKAKEELSQVKKQLDIFDKVQILLQKTSDFAREQIKSKIEDIVSEALNVVYGGRHKFTIELDTYGKRPIVKYFLDDGTTFTQLEKPDYDRGGGKIDVITLSLRLAISEIEGVKGPVFLDEVGKHVDQEVIPNVAYFLKEFSTRFNKQIILITHNTALGAIGDISIHVRKERGESKVTIND